MVCNCALCHLISLLCCVFPLPTSLSDLSWVISLIYHLKKDPPFKVSFRESDLGFLLTIISELRFSRKNENLNVTLLICLFFYSAV